MRILWSLLYKWGNWCPERFDNLPKVIQLGSGGSKKRSSSWAGFSDHSFIGQYCSLVSIPFRIQNPPKNPLAMGLPLDWICMLGKQQIIIYHFFLCLDRRHGVFFSSADILITWAPLSNWSNCNHRCPWSFLPFSFPQIESLLRIPHEIVQLSLCVLKSLLFENSFICEVYYQKHREERKEIPYCRFLTYPVFYKNFLHTLNGSCT